MLGNHIMPSVSTFPDAPHASPVAASGQRHRTYIPCPTRITMTRLRRSLPAVFCVAYLMLSASLVQGQVGPGEHWVGTWATALVAQPASSSSFANQTLRQVVRVSLGGDRLRITFSNVYGTQPLTIGAATVARQADAEAIIPASNRPLTFGGRQSVTIPPGASVLSDAVALNVPALSDVAIDLYVPGDTSASESPITQHSAAIQTSYTSMPGDHTGRDDFPVDTTTTSWFFLARVDVVAPEHIGAVVLFGDSITDGSGSTLDTNNRWPDHLARRLHNANIRFGILNLGIAGNRVLSDGLGVSALARFDREVLAQPGVTHVIVLEGINDIGLALTDIGIPRTDPPPTAEDIIFGHQQLIERARTRNVQIYGATFLPFAGTSLARIPNYYSTDGDTTRQTVNAWIRTSGAYDAVIDFDAALQNPEAPLEMLPRYDSGDGLHPGDTGYEAMANTLDLELLQVAEPGNAR